jgi:nitrate/TMAO reductase-like tetraheme cytochrome c subunit
MRLFFGTLALIFVFGGSVNAYDTKDMEKYYSEDSYPTAAQCAGCHQQIYNEWASSNHAYASISPMFHKFEQAINDLSAGTIGTFCVRCHQQVGTQRGEERELPLWDRSQVAREGITCVTCHRVQEEFTKVNGERTVVPGDIHAPVGGTMRDSVFDQVLERKDELRLATSDGERGQKIHAGVYKFEQLGKSEFCVSCHQVAVNLGIKLEVVWDQYRDSPAHAKGETCQDCHMGKVPGVAAGYETAPSAIVNGEEINPGRRHSNHAFYGPGYPIAHPGIFPHNVEAARWTIQEWLKFNYRAGWGSGKFEEAIEDIEEPLDEFNTALEPLGGHPVTLDALATIEAAAARGASAFKRKTSLKPLQVAIEAISEAVSTDDVRGQITALEAAIEGLEEAVSSSKSVTAPNSYKLLTHASKKLAQTAIQKLASSEAQIEKTGQLLGAFSTATNADERKKILKDLRIVLPKLRSSLPGADNEYVGAITALKASMGVNFPGPWIDAGDREEAWEIVVENRERLEEKRELRKQVMENGSKIDGPFFSSTLKTGNDLAFNYVITNTDDGHNLPSGSLGAQPEIWFNVALIDPDGKNIWESGHVDSNGDFADLHSLDLAAGKIEHDDQLFNLQTKFLTTNVKGTDREMYLPVNFDIDQQPLLRPSNVPATVLNHAPFVRMEGRSIPPLGNKKAKYKIPGELLKKPGKYRLMARLRSRAEPIYFMRFVGATSEMEEAMNEWMLDIHPNTVEFEVK